ncbi:MAG: DUF1320 domain-containing protein [Gammaproteobacteria bacterium]|nr:DUF1320 domain-containing protein [Gammaproteobacteria bacterium]
MPYCIEQDLIDRFGEDEIITLTDKENIGEIVTTTLNRAIQDAEGIIDGHVGARYSLPISPVSKNLVRIACQLARYSLYDKHRPENIRQEYDDAIRDLKLIAQGKIDIGIDTSGDKAASKDTVEFEGGSNVFDRKDTGFI